MIGWRIAIWVAVVLVTLVFLYLVRSILLPFGLALLISVLLDPTIRKLRMRGYKRSLAVLIVFVGFFGILGLIGVRLAPLAGNQLASFRNQLEVLTNKLTAEDPNANYFRSWNPVAKAAQTSSKDFVDTFFEDNKGTLERFGIPTSKRAFIDQYVTPQRQNLGKIVQNFFNSFLGIVSAATSQVLLLLLTPILVFLILNDLEKFRARSVSYIPPAIRKETLQVLSDIGAVFISYLRGVTTTIAIYFVLMAVLLWLLGAPYFVLLALLFASLYLIPMLGSLINAATLFLVTGLHGVSGHLFIHLSSPWLWASVITLVYLAVHLVFDNLVYPKLVGQAVGLHPVVSMFVIFSGGALFGLIGMIFAFPLAGSIKVLLERLLRVASVTDGVTLRLPAVPMRHRAASEV